MDEIDWSKAPEGADKYNTYNRLFYKGAQPDLQVFTRGQWKQSVFVKSDERFVCRPTTPSWSGEGLPPVGAVCERCWSSSDRTYHLVKILAHDDGFAVYRWLAGIRAGELQQNKQEQAQNLWTFRPIRTPEQIAADEREAAIDEMLAATPAPGSDISLRVCERLYDAGYRKP